MMNKFNIFILLFGLALVVSASSGDFLEFGAGARAVGMGEAFTSVSGDPYCIYWNPAGLADLGSKALVLSHSELYSGIRHEFASYSQPFGGLGTLGVAATALYMSDFEKRSGPTDEPDGSFSAMDLALTIGWGKEVFKDFSVGVNVKGIYETIDTEKALGLSLDAGVHGRTDFVADLLLFSINLPGLNYGIVLQNAALPMKYVEKEFYLPLTLKGGVSFKQLNDTLTCSVDLVYRVNDRLGVDLGVEYNYMDLLYARAGYRYNDNDFGSLAGLTAGFGLQIDAYSLDYAFVPAGDLGFTHRMSLGIKFGIAIKEEEAIVQKMETRLKDRNLQLLAKYNEAARAGLAAGDLQEAGLNYNKALAIDEKNEEALAGLKRIEDLTVNRLFKEGVEFFNQNKIMLAHSKFERVLELRPSFKDESGLIAKTNTAIADNEKLAKDKTEVDEHLKRAKEALERPTPDYRAAIQEYDAVVKLVSADVYMQLLNETIAKFEKAVSDGIKNALILRNTRKPDDLVFAVKELKGVQAIDPVNKDAARFLMEWKGEMERLAKSYYYKALDEYGTGDSKSIKSAVEKWDKVLILDPENVNAKINREKASRKLEGLEKK